MTAASDSTQGDNSYFNDPESGAEMALVDAPHAGCLTTRAGPVCPF